MILSQSLSTQNGHLGTFPYLMTSQQFSASSNVLISFHWPWSMMAKYGFQRLDPPRSAYSWLINKTWGYFRFTRLWMSFLNMASHFGLFCCMYGPFVINPWVIISLFFLLMWKQIEEGTWHKLLGDLLHSLQHSMWPRRTTWRHGRHEFCWVAAPYDQCSTKEKPQPSFQHLLQVTHHNICSNQI